MRRTVVLVSLAAVLISCANPTFVTPGAGGPDPDDPHAALALDAYEAVIRELVGLERIEWETIYVQGVICDNGGTAEEPVGCDERLSDAERSELRDRLADLEAPVRFVDTYREADPDDRILEGRERSVFVALGPISRGPEGSLEVPGGMHCGGLCGRGATWRLVRRDGRWVVNGAVDGSAGWIA